MVIGKQNSNEYQDNPWYLGACIVRFSGRISDKYTIDDKTFILRMKKGFNYIVGNKDGIVLLGK